MKRMVPPPRKTETIDEDEIFDIIPEDHQLKIIKNEVNWKPIEEKVSSVYAQRMGRPLKFYPLQVFLALFIQRYAGLSDEATQEGIRYNMLYRWFCGFGPREEIFNKTELWYLRHKLIEADIYHEFLYEINRQMMEKGLIASGETLFVDSTLMHTLAKRLTLNQFIQDTIRKIMHSLEKNDKHTFAELKETYTDTFDYILKPRESTLAWLDGNSRTRSLETLYIDSCELFSFLFDFDLSEESQYWVDFLERNLGQHIEVDEFRDPTPPSRGKKLRKARVKVPAEKPENSDTGDASHDDDDSEQVEEGEAQPEEAEAAVAAIKDDDETTLKNDAEEKNNDDHRWQLGPTETGVKNISNRRITGPRDISPHDPDARYGRGGPGYRTEVITNKRLFIIDLRTYSGDQADGQHYFLLDMIRTIQEETGFVVITLVGDSHYGGQKLVEILDQHGVRVIAKPGVTNVDLEVIMFQVDREAETCQCPEGLVVPLKKTKKGDRVYAHFPVDPAHPTGCKGCPLWDTCGGEVGALNRIVRFPASEALGRLIADLHDPESEAWELLRMRNWVAESPFASLKIVLKLEHARVIGIEPVEFDSVMGAIVHNSKTMVAELKRERSKLREELSIASGLAASLATRMGYGKSITGVPAQLSRGWVRYGGSVSLSAQVSVPV